MEEQKCILNTTRSYRVHNRPIHGLQMIQQCGYLILYCKYTLPLLKSLQNVESLKAGILKNMECQSGDRAKNRSKGVNFLMPDRTGGM